MKTRDKILLQARLLFNIEGTEGVSLRQLARKLEISDGNLRYHFKSKEELLEALYYQLVEKLHVVIDQMEKEDFLHVKGLYKQMYVTYEQLLAYKFFMLDFVSIMRRHPAIGVHFRQLQFLRRQQFRQIVDRLIEEGVMRPAVFADEYAHLHERTQILSDFWISSAEVMQHDTRKNPVRYYTRIILSALFPYLTPAAQADFLKLPG